MSPLELLHNSAEIIVDKKAFGILALDLRDFSSVSDFVLIAEGNVERHVLAIADSLVRELRDKGQRPLCLEGRRDPSWILIDYSSVAVHLFAPSWRECFALEELWSGAPQIDLSHLDPEKKSV